MTAETRTTRLPSERQLFWRHARRSWDLAFYALVAISAVSLTVSGGSARADLPTLVSLTGLAVLVVAYIFLGRRGSLRGDVRLTRSYVAVLIVVTAVTSGVNPLGTVLLFLAFSQAWYFAERLSEGAIASTVLAVAVFIALAVQVRGTGENLLDLAAQMTVALVFSLTLGLWITRVAEQSEARAELIERLEATRAELAATHHTAGVLAERERMAQEIHDTLAQGFTSVVMLAQAATAQIEHGRTGPAAQRLAQIEAVARENLAEARALVAAFGPTALEGSTFAEALERLAQRFEEETGVVVQLVLVAPDRASDADSIGRDTEVVLLRAAQEALANVRRHAGARRVQLTLSHEDGEVGLDVLDDGRGLTGGTAEGVGLRGMRERVRAGGGMLDVSGAPGEGTRVRLRLPVRHDDSGDAGDASLVTGTQS